MINKAWPEEKGLYWDRPSRASEFTLDFVVGSVLPFAIVMLYIFFSFVQCLVPNVTCVSELSILYFPLRFSLIFIQYNLIKKKNTTAYIDGVKQTNEISRITWGNFSKIFVLFEYSILYFNNYSCDYLIHLIAKHTNMYLICHLCHSADIGEKFHFIICHVIF